MRPEAYGMRLVRAALFRHPDDLAPVIYPGLQVRCAACGRPFTWRADHRGRIIAIDDEPRTGGIYDVIGDADYATRIGHPAVSAYVAHAAICVQS